MSLIQLLSVGRTLRGGHNQPAPYRMTQPYLLPKFSSLGRSVSLAPPDLFEGRSVAALDHATSRSCPRPAARLATARSVGKPTWVQSDLMVHSIQVVRNDLREADVEVVARMPQAGRVSSGPFAGPAMMWAWQRIAARVWHAARSLM